MSKTEPTENINVLLRGYKVIQSRQRRESQLNSKNQISEIHAPTKAR